MPDSAERWQAFLSALTDEELERYREIAADQVKRETKDRWLQLVLAGLALAAAAWFLGELVLGVYWVSAILILGLSAALGYWPYRRARTRRLWQAHCAAVRAEQERRRSVAS